METENWKKVTYWKQVGDDLKRLCDVPEALTGHLDKQLLEAAAVQHTNNRLVYVLAVDEDVAAQWQPPRGTAKMVVEGHLFPSALAASLHLGFDHNTVGDRLGKDRRKREEEAAKKMGNSPMRTRVRPVVTIRGVTLQYEDDVKE